MTFHVYSRKLTRWNIYGDTFITAAYSNAKVNLRVQKKVHEAEEAVSTLPVRNVTIHHWSFLISKLYPLNSRTCAGGPLNLESKLIIPDQ
jgi:hypothetical protein